MLRGVIRVLGYGVLFGLVGAFLSETAPYGRLRLEPMPGSPWSAFAVGAVLGLLWAWVNGRIGRSSEPREPRPARHQDHERDQRNQ
jgi:hypothetical protein